MKPYRKRIVWLLFQFSRGWYIALAEKFFLHGGRLGTLGSCSLQIGNSYRGQWGFCGQMGDVPARDDLPVLSQKPRALLSGLPSAPGESSLLWSLTFPALPSFGWSCPHRVILQFSLSFLIWNLEALTHASECRPPGQPAHGCSQWTSCSFLHAPSHDPYPVIRLDRLLFRWIFCYCQVSF